MECNNYNKKVLILCPLPEIRGGVADYYSSLRNNFKSRNLVVEYYFTGKKSEYPNLFSRIVYSVKDLFYLCRSFQKYDLIHLNPSLDPNALIRDGVYHFIAKRIFKRKTLVFFRGWHAFCEKTIEKRFIRIFRLFFNFDYALVLASSFKDKLICWGYKPDLIKVETTTVDDELLNGFSIEERIRRIDSLIKIDLLFLARIEKEKGICETIEAFKILLERYPDLRLVVAGDGAFMNEARKFASRVGLKDKVSFLGYVRGEEKKNLFKNTDIYVFPTYHGEGMPTSVLEAMAFGLPVITRPVGGLKDFFIDGKHGFITESKNAEIIACLIEKLILDKELWKKMSINVHKYAKERFMASKVAKRLEGIYVTTIKN